jgi:hypothetical protein
MSRLPGPENNDPFSLLLPTQTPGPLGHNDAGDPNAKAVLGNTPGPLGIRDGGGNLFNWLAGGRVEAGRAGWVRPELRGLKPMGQSFSTLCWLTCYQMMYIWKGLDPTTIESKLRGAAGVDFAGACTRGLLDDEMPGAAQALGLATVAEPGGITLAHLKVYLRVCPLWVAGEWFQNGKHVRLLVGAGNYHVEYFDPWWGGNAGGQAEKHTEIIDTFLHGDGKTVHGMDKMAGKHQLQWWRH